MSWPWSELGLEGPADLETIKHAYAQRLKTTHPEEDPEGFQRLHAAYQQARRSAKAQAAQEETEETEKAGEERLDRNAFLGDVPPLHSPKPSGDKDFDFQRLIAEGDEERRQAQRRRVEEHLRTARERRLAQNAGRGNRTLETEVAWQAAFDALYALEALLTSGASVPDWVQFLHSDAFRNAQHNLDFVFGLEDFLAAHPRLPDEIKRDMFLVYGFSNQRPQPAYMGLYNQLRPACKAIKQPENQGETWRHRMKRRKKLWKNLLFLCLLFFVIFFGTIALALLSPNRLDRPVDRLLNDMEEDFGEEFILLSTLDEKAHRFRLGPAEGDGFRFVATYTGDRDAKNGKLGYETNYTDKQFFLAMRELSRRWPDYKLQFNKERNLVIPYGEVPLEPPTYFLFELPLTGAEGFIEDLVETLAELREEDWYRTLPPRFQLILDHGGKVLASLDQDSPAMDWAGVLDYYRDLYPFEFLQDVVISGGLAREDFTGDTVDLIGAFATGVDGETYFSITCTGVDETGAEKNVSYYLTLEGDVLYILPHSRLGQVINYDYDKTLQFANETIAVFRAVEN